MAVRADMSAELWRYDVDTSSWDQLVSADWFAPYALCYEFNILDIRRDLLLYSGMCQEGQRLFRMLRLPSGRLTEFPHSGVYVATIVDDNQIIGFAHTETGRVPLSISNEGVRTLEVDPVPEHGWYDPDSQMLVATISQDAREFGVFQVVWER